MPDAVEDVVLVHSRAADGEGYNVLRKRGDELSVGQVRPVVEGAPLHGELLKLEPREGTPLFDVQVLYEPPPSAERSGPAQVATQRYRRGWDAVFHKNRDAN